MGMPSQTASFISCSQRSVDLGALLLRFSTRSIIIRDFAFSYIILTLASLIVIRQYVIYWLSQQPPENRDRAAPPDPAGARRPRAAARREPRTHRGSAALDRPNRELWQRSHVFRRNSNASDRPDRSSGSGSSSTMTKLECVRSRAQAAELPPQCRPPGR